jgi:flavin-dependent dehydrogenase
MVFDVLIAGAGPAGCAAAIRAAAGGLRVALIEKAAFPRDLPGEALHPDAGRLFARLGVTAAIAKAGFLTSPGWIRERSGERSFIPFEGPSGLRFGNQAWRSELDAILLAQARRVGVTVVQPAAIGKLLSTGSGVAGLEVGGEAWLGRYVVDCSGAARWLSRSLGLPAQPFSPRLIARYAYFGQACPVGAIPEFREHPCGWTWLARVRKDRCQCVRLALAAVPLPALDDLPSDARFRGADVTWRLVPQCAGEGYFLCGDAAAVLDPAASSGVARALASGIKAAESILQVVKGRMDSPMAAAAYRRWYARLFIEQARQLAQRYAELDHPTLWLASLERQFSELRRFLSKPLANSGNSVITSS